MPIIGVGNCRDGSAVLDLHLSISQYSHSINDQGRTMHQEVIVDLGLDLSPPRVMLVPMPM
jgi:hypothetical protein